MLNKKSIGITCFVIIAIVSSAIYLFYTPETAMQKEIQAYVDKLQTFSGKLTPAEKKDYLETLSALEKLSSNLKDPSDIDRLISPSDFEALQKHTEKIIGENPGIIPAHSHVDGPGHEEVYQQEQIKQAELTKINAAIEDLQASSVAESTKEILLRVFEHRRAVLLDSGNTARKMEILLEEITKKEPDVVALDWGTSGYKKIYEHHLEIEKERRHHPDGTVEEVFVFAHYGSTDRKLSKALTKYVDELKRIPPGKPHPPPPEHKDLRYFIEYEDVYVDENGKRVSNPLPKELEQAADVLPEQAADVLPDVLTENPSEEIPFELSQKHPDTMITPEEVETWQSFLDTLEVNEMAEIRDIFEQAAGIPIERFLEMSDAKIASKFQAQFSVSPSEDATVVEKLEKLKTLSGTDVSTRSKRDFERRLLEKYSVSRFKRAVSFLNHHGPEIGLRRLQEVDPDVAADVKRFLQKQQEE